MHFFDFLTFSKTKISWFIFINKYINNIEVNYCTKVPPDLPYKYCYYTRLTSTYDFILFLAEFSACLIIRQSIFILSLVYFHIDVLVAFNKIEVVNIIIGTVYHLKVRRWWPGSRDVSVCLWKPARSLHFKWRLRAGFHTSYTIPEDQEHKQCVLPIFTSGTEKSKFITQIMRKNIVAKRALEHSALGDSLIYRVPNVERWRKTKINDVGIKISRLKWRRVGHLARRNDV